MGTLAKTPQEPLWFQGSFGCIWVYFSCVLFLCTFSLPVYFFLTHTVTRTETYVDRSRANYKGLAASSSTSHLSRAFLLRSSLYQCCADRAYPDCSGRGNAVFSYPSHFLHTGFYSVLTAGSAPQRCLNRGRYFLPTAGYNTCQSKPDSCQEKPITYFSSTSASSSALSITISISQ